MAGPETPGRPADTLVSAPRGLGADSRLVLMAGVAGACLLGAAAGAWVRPEADDLKAREAVRPTARSAPPMAPAPQMRIVMDAEALPARPPMEVLPDWARAPAPPPPLAPPIPEFEPPLPRDEPLVRLLRVQDEPVRAAPTPEAPEKAKPKPAKVEVAKADKPKAKSKRAEKVELAKAEKPKKAEKAMPKKVELARAETSKKTEGAKAEKAKLAKAKKTKATELAKADKAKKKAKPDKVELARADKAKKPEKPKTAKIVLAKAEPKPKAPEKAKSKPMAVLLAEIEKLKAKPVEAPPVKLAEAKPPPPPKAAAPVKVAKATAKASRAPTQPARRAENQWADDDLRLARAYRRAAEAGVPEWRLERQQARWRQARDAAEREAPWAVTRVYEARIAELDDLAGEAAMEWN